MAKIVVTPIDSFGRFAVDTDYIVAVKRFYNDIQVGPEGTTYKDNALLMLNLGGKAKGAGELNGTMQACEESFDEIMDMLGQVEQVVFTKREERKPGLHVTEDKSEIIVPSMEILGPDGSPASA